MWLDAALAFGHFLFVFVVVGALSAELFVMRLAPSAPVLALLARIDLFFGLSSGGVIAAGLARVFFGLKDEGFYAASHAFWGKMAVFLLIGLLSILPTLRFVQWARAARRDPAFAPPAAQWKSVRRIVLIEAHLLVLVIIFAAMMARGIG